MYNILILLINTGHCYMPSINDLSKLQLLPVTGDCGICLEKDKQIYTHGAHNANSAICAICAEQLIDPKCPFCRENLIGEESLAEKITSGKSYELHPFFIWFFSVLTPNCRRIEPPLFKKDDRDPPMGGCAAAAGLVMQNNLNDIDVF